MKALLKDDLIIKVTIDDPNGVEIGNVPNGVGLERLRWNGSSIVDLIAPRVIHVEHLGSNYFELHIIPLAGTQPIYMSYKQKKDLRYNNLTGMIYLASEAVKAYELKDEQIKMIKAGLKRYLGRTEDVFLKHFAFTAALIVYASEQPTALKDFFDDIAPVIKDSFPLSRWEDILRSFGRDIKGYLEDYYSKLDE